MYVYLGKAHTQTGDPKANINFIYSFIKFGIHSLTSKPRRKYADSKSPPEMKYNWKFVYQKSIFQF